MPKLILIQNGLSEIGNNFTVFMEERQYFESNSSVLSEFSEPRPHKVKPRTSVALASVWTEGVYFFENHVRNF